MRRIKRHISGLFLLPAIAVILSITVSCSTTSRLAEGEKLYNGMKLKLNPTDKEKLPSEMVADLTKAVNARPNNPWPLLSPYSRNPFPLGLWVYNHWSDSAKGVKGWLYRKLVEQPVLVSDVKPEMRVKMLEDILDNNGYFGSTASFTLKSNKNPKIEKVLYTVDVTKPYLIDSIQYLDGHGVLDSLINRYARRSNYLVKGERFCVDSLSAERVRIANGLRNRGYYYFRPEYIEFLADSLITPHAVALRLTLAANMPKLAAPSV